MSHLVEPRLLGCPKCGQYACDCNTMKDAIDAMSETMKPLSQEWLEQEKSARAMERIEAAAERIHDTDYTWSMVSAGFFLLRDSSVMVGQFVAFLSIRDDEQDPLEAAEQAAMRELRHG